MAEAVTWSYHTHNTYCDGDGSIEEMVQAAVDAGLTHVGISSHAPLPLDVDWTMPLGRLPDYIREVREVQQRFRDRIAVLLGLEVDFLPDTRVTEFQEREIFALDFDFYVGSIHFLGTGHPLRSFDDGEEHFTAIMREGYGGDVTSMVSDYYSRIRQMLRMPHVTIVGHMDRIKRWNAGGKYWREDDPWYVETVDETVRAIAASGTFVELNTGGWRKGQVEPYPSPWVLARCKEYGVPVTVSSDAHEPGKVISGFDRAERCLDELGITPVPLPVVL